MTELLDILNEYIWISDFVVLCTFAVLAIKQRQNNSTLMTITLVVLMTGIVINYQSLVNSFVAPNTSHSAFILWCIGFVVFDCFVAFILFKYYQLYKNKRSTTVKILFIILATVFVTCVVISQFGPLLFGIDGLSYKVWRLTAFDLGTVILFGLVVYSIWQTHILSEKPYSLIASMYLLAFFVAANIHIATFVELFFWQTHYLSYVYQWGLASINICTTLVTIFIAGLAIFQYLRKESREGLLWEL